MIVTAVRRTEVPPVAWRVLGLSATGAALLLFAFSGRYGYHRDELYYLVADWLGRGSRRVRAIALPALLVINAAVAVALGLPVYPVSVVADTHCTSMTVVARNDNGHGVDNDEQHAPISLCAGLTGSWSAIWTDLRHL